MLSVAMSSEACQQTVGQLALLTADSLTRLVRMFRRLSTGLGARYDTVYRQRKMNNGVELKTWCRK